MLFPLKIERKSNNSIVITWNDGHLDQISSEALRKNCPCASCKDLRGDPSHKKPLSGKKSALKIIEHTKDEELNLLNIKPIGNYAINLHWADGHATGIYTFELLRDIAQGSAT
ncbi:MAG: DUF971 domain-containing protein [bacterium]|nr:DUF971 domain-containing protein [bacterium]